MLIRLELEPGSSSASAVACGRAGRDGEGHQPHSLSLALPLALPVATTGPWVIPSWRVLGRRRCLAQVLVLGVRMPCLCWDECKQGPALRLAKVRPICHPQPG